MILVFEMVWTGTHHAPGNSATLQTIARAMPGETIRVFAEPSHLAELQADPALVANRGMSFVPIRISPYFRTKPHVVSARRFRQELATMAAALRAVPGDEPCLIFLISASSTAIYAAKLLAALSRRRVAIQVGMHGNLAEITGWRSRNPLIRAFDLRSALTSRHRVRLRFLVLEDAIRRELEHLAPEAAKRCDVLPLPINRAEIAAARPIALAAPLRIGFVGQGTEAKGITAFLETARLLKARHGSRIDFFLVGRPALGSDLARFSVLSHTVSPDHLSRDEFRTLLGSLHYVFLPFQPGYYNLSASGALIDAITWLKPVIATKLPFVEDLFARHGDIGFACDTIDDMRAVLDEAVERPDPARYERQIESLRRARETREPEALARVYRAILHDGFGDFLAARPAAPGLRPHRAGTGAGA